MAWLKERGAIEHALHTSVDGLPSERDVTLARMGDVLQATAQGLQPQAAAVWAGVPEPVLQGWIDNDPAFASALYAATALAAAHGLKRGRHTPAMLRVLLVAMSNGTTTVGAIKLAGFPGRHFRSLVRASSALEALLEAARRARPLKARSGAFVPSSYRPRRPGQKPPSPWTFRLVRRGDPDMSQTEPDA
ncbi:hypothetical protein EAO75_31480 [Streptomyces sp. uw30]|nr:hypothetical protein EAO75_31480 [Streptomyces sp. uw30]